MGHATEITKGERFEFGANWQRFLNQVDDEHIVHAERTLSDMLDVEDLDGKRFLDIGSGSGLFSLGARRLNATVHSFDYDPKSVQCTTQLKQRFFPDDPSWVVEEGSILDPTYLSRLGTFDVVYSWGVLHHTGSMWEAVANALSLVNPGGELFISIYNDQGRASTAWKSIKKTYCSSPKLVKPLVLAPLLVRLWGPTMVRDLVTKRNPLETWQHYGEGAGRGMSPWTDVIDWVGGYPFEVAKPEQVFDFCSSRGFRLNKLLTCAGGKGCNQFVFTREATEHKASLARTDSQTR